MTATARLALDLPDGSVALISSGDNSLAASYQRIDDAAGTKNVATVASVAGALTYQGSAAYATTPLEGAHYSGSAWKFTGSDACARGGRNYGENATQTTVTSETKLKDLIFSAVTGRKYWCEYFTFLKFSTAELPNEARLNVRWDASLATSVSSTLLETHEYTVASWTADNEGIGVMHGFEFFPNVTADITIGLYWKVVSKTIVGNVASCRTTFNVEDWGV